MYKEITQVCRHTGAQAHRHTYRHMHRLMWIHTHTCAHRQVGRWTGRHG